MDALTIETRADGIAVATMNLPGRPMNVVNDALIVGIAEAVERLADPAVRGLILTSSKADFCAGGDLDNMSKWTRAEQAFDTTQAMKAVLRRLELQGKPVVAAINGHALGGGLEIALACHARIAIDDPRIKLGQPEVKLGLLPGGGGTVRLPRLLGIRQALKLMIDGDDIAPAAALLTGLLTALARDRDDLIAKAREWILANAKAVQPWDAPNFRFPGGDSRAPAVAQLFLLAPSAAAAKGRGALPAVTHIMSSVFEGGLLAFDAASTLESRYFAACAMSAESRNMIAAWYALNTVRKGASRPARLAASKVAKLGVLGAGMMGAGIAAAAARAGIDVVLIDTTQAAAERGKAHAQALADKAVAAGRATADARASLLTRVTPTTDHALLAGCEMVIEAVFEDRAVKAAVTAQAERHLGADAVFASNTSTLPISGLAQASLRPQNFIGLHFCSPVHRMQLVEIIVGERTAPVTLARAFDFARQIGKTPIVVNGARGFYTSRVFATYILEGAAMLADGVHPRSIEAAGSAAGMPMPPLALHDEVSLSICMAVAEQTKADMAVPGEAAHPEHPGLAVVRRFCEIGRTGKKCGRGFYDWQSEGGGRLLWPGLTALYPLTGEQPPQQELIDRLLFAQASEAARCVDEGVVRSAADANVGSVLGWGFPTLHGGALQFIDAMGAATFAARAQALAAKFGPRFAPAKNIADLAQTGGRFSAEALQGEGKPNEARQEQVADGTDRERRGKR